MIYKDLQIVRCEVQKRATKKSGKNKFAGFEYFELKDFLPIANEEFLKVGITPLFSIYQETKEDGTILEKAVLKIVSDNDKEHEIIFETPTAEANVKGANDIQNLGSKHTYLKRYLYMNALELSESDSVDATIGKEEPKREEKPKEKLAMATQKQIDIILKGYTEERLNKMLLHYGLVSVNELNVVQASEAIKVLERDTNGTGNNQ